MIQTVSGRRSGAEQQAVSGSIPIPASKSHTIRALLIAAFADGESILEKPLVSRDTLSCRSAVEELGARVRDDGENWIVEGFGPIPPDGASIDVGNSGTSLYLSAALAALGNRPVRFDGDSQIRRRSAKALLDALKELGVRVESMPGGCAPFTVQGPMRGGQVAIDCPVSQYLSALIMAAPLVQSGSGQPTRIRISSLNEAPYVEMTLAWLDHQGIRYQREGWDEFRIPPGQRYKPFGRVIPADWSSAAFFMAAAAISGGTLFLENLDINDSQGDKSVLGMLESMGCRSESSQRGVRITGGPLRAAELDLNATPDALPALAAVCCCAEGESRLVNVPQARMKETDRIAVVCAELQKLGVRISERPDGLVIQGRPDRPFPSSLPGEILEVDGHHDHRVVMALAAAALGCEGALSIQGAEAADITFPGFFDLLAAI